MIPRGDPCHDQDALDRREARWSEAEAEWAARVRFSEMVEDEPVYDDEQWEKHG